MSIDTSIKEELFLAEFLVDSVNIVKRLLPPRLMKKIPEGISSKIFISFKILDLPCHKIYQDCGCSTTELQVFNKGCSFLFALPHDVLEKPWLFTFYTEISVCRELPPTYSPNVISLGSLTGHEEIYRLVNSVLSNKFFHNINSHHATKNTYPLLRPGTGLKIGEVTLFMRVSALGKHVVTQFQMSPDNPELYCFKRTDSDSLLSFKKITPAPDQCLCEKTDGNGEAAAIGAAVICDEQRREEQRRLEDEKCAPCCPEKKVTVSPKQREPIVKKCGCSVQLGDS